MDDLYYFDQNIFVILITLVILSHSSITIIREVTLQNLMVA